MMVREVGLWDVLRSGSFAGTPRLKISPLPGEAISSSWHVSVNSGLTDSFVDLAKRSPPPSSAHTSLPCSGHVYLRFATACAGEWVWNEDTVRTPGVSTMPSSMRLKWEERREDLEGAWCSSEEMYHDYIYIGQRFFTSWSAVRC